MNWKYVHTKAYTWMYTAALFLVTKTWKQPRYSSVDDWIINCDTPRQWNIFQCLKEMSYQAIKRHGKKHKCILCVRAKSFQSFGPWVTLWTIACQAPLSMGFSRQECWSGLPCSLPRDLPDPGIEPRSLMSPALTGGFLTTRATWKAPECILQKEY